MTSARWLLMLIVHAKIRDWRLDIVKQQTSRAPFLSLKRRIAHVQFAVSATWLPVAILSIGAVLHITFCQFILNPLRVTGLTNDRDGSSNMVSDCAGI
jgi:hypothetical protein